MEGYDRLHLAVRADHSRPGVTTTAATNSTQRNITWHSVVCPGNGTGRAVEYQSGVHSPLPELSRCPVRILLYKDARVKLRCNIVQIHGLSGAVYSARATGDNRRKRMV
jgi:hypothetical protein